MTNITNIKILKDENKMVALSWNMLKNKISEDGENEVETWIVHTWEIKHHNPVYLENVDGKEREEFVKVNLQNVLTKQPITKIV